jgi:hypothetical protein
VAAGALSTKLTKIEEALYQTKNKSSQDPLNFPIRLNNKLSNLTGVVDAADAAPPDQAYTVYDDIAGQIDVQLGMLKAALATDLTAFNTMVRDQSVPAVVVKEKKERGGAAGGRGRGEPADADDHDR